MHEVEVENILSHDDLLDEHLIILQERERTLNDDEVEDIEDDEEQLVITLQLVKDEME